MSGVVVHGPTFCEVDINYTTLLHSTRQKFDYLHLTTKDPQPAAIDLLWTVENLVRID